MTDGEWRRRIREERDALRCLLADMERDGLGETQGESLGEVSVYDNHPADIGTETWERSKDLALWCQLPGRVAAMEEALLDEEGEPLDTREGEEPRRSGEPERR